MMSPKKRILAIGNEDYLQSLEFDLCIEKIPFDSSLKEKNQRRVLTANLLQENPSIDAICIAMDDTSEIELVKELCQYILYLHEKALILLANNLRMDRGLYIWALEHGVTAVFAKDEVSFQDLEARIMGVIDVFIPPSQDVKIPLSFPYASKELKIQVEQFFDTVSQNDTFSYAIQGEPGIGKHHLIRNLESVTISPIKYVNCDLDIDSESFDPNMILVISELELSVRYIQEQLLNLLSRAIKIIFIVRHDFEDICKLQDAIHPDLIGFVRSASKIILPPLRDQLNNLEIYIDLLLRDKTICARHLSNYFCQPAQSVFGSEILELFKQYSWPGNFNELREIVQFTLTKAEIIHQSTVTPLTKELLPTRVLYQQKGQSSLALLSRKAKVEQFFSDLNKALILADQKLDELFYGQSEQLIRHKLRQFHDEFSDVLVTRASPGIFHFFKIALMICYDMNSKEISNQFQKHIKLLEERYPLEISNNQPGGGDDISQTIHERLSKSSIICLLICVDFMYGIEDEKTHKQIFDYLQNLRKPHQQVFSPIAKECSLDGYRSLLGEIIRPNGKAINLHDDLDRVLTSICDTSIRNALDQLKFMPSSF